MFDFNKKENDSEYEGIKPITPLRELYEEQTREERDLDIHLKKMRAWN